MTAQWAMLPRPHAGLFGLATCVFFCAASWSAAFAFETPSRKLLLGVLAFSYVSTIPFYFHCRGASMPPFRWQVGAIVVALFILVTPSLLQTDQLRYLWDGLLSLSGANPFRLSPKEKIDAAAALGEAIPQWATYINHPELPTLYPPAAQLGFLLGAAGNPLLGTEHIPTWMHAWLRRLPPTFFWPYELGWRLVVAACAATTVFVLRRRRWDLLAFHPLFLLVVVLNVHVDALLMPALAWIFRHSRREGQEARAGAALGVGILLRWTPILFLPSLLVSWCRKRGPQSAILASMVAASLVVLGISVFWRGAEGRFFASTKVYGEHWMFFGYLHRFLADGLSLIGLADESISIAKGTLSLAFVAFLAVVVRRQARGVFSLRLSCLLVLGGALAVSPTLHPWYLLSLIVVGLPYMKTLTFPWLWPLLAPASYAFYLENKDPFVVRLLVYGVVSLSLWCDLRRLFRSRSTLHA